ncbi:MAG: hypothetical protein AAF202_13235 [Pseudomonadota bacterium]
MMISWRHVLVFLFFSCLQVRIVDAKDYRIPVEDPENCLRGLNVPCAISTGDEPKIFSWNQAQFELDRNLVLQIKKKKVWRVYQGMLVVKTTEPLRIHTPFAEIFLGASKAMIHVLGNRVRVLSLNGEGIKVISRPEKEEHFLVPGFQNWYGGYQKEGPHSGVVSVIDFEDYAQKRAKFFMDYKYGFIQELRQVGSVVKWAAKMAAEMHRDLVERKMASLEVQHQEKRRKKHQKIQFNKYLRQLFLRKIRYDD